MPLLRKTLTRLSLVGLLAISLAGCGFHLQGQYQIPQSLQKLHLDSNDQYSEITRLVKTQLQRHQITLSEQASAPTLRLSNERFERGTLSLFSNGQVAEYELIYTLEYQVIRANKEPQSFEVIIRRDYLDDPQSAQAKSREREQLLREIRQQAAKQITAQLSQLN